jgi:hypothetical protein
VLEHDVAGSHLAIAGHGHDAVSVHAQDRRASDRTHWGMSSHAVVSPHRCSILELSLREAQGNARGVRSMSNVYSTPALLEMYGVS